MLHIISIINVTKVSHYTFHCRHFEIDFFKSSDLVTLLMNELRWQKNDAIVNVY